MGNRSWYWHYMYLHPLILHFCLSVLGLWHCTLQLPAIWLGDFNTTFNPDLDRLHVDSPAPTLPQPTRFAKLVASFNLIDTWTSVHPEAQAFSCFSSSHHSMFRIDLILISSSLLLDCRMQVYPWGHSWIIVLVGPRWHYHRLNPFWLTLLPEDDDILTDWEHYFKDSKGSAYLHTAWDAFKLHARSTLATRINWMKRTSETDMEKVMAGLVKAERAFVDDPSVERVNTIRLHSRVVTQLQTIWTWREGW